ncbi:MAG: hypothetical protein ACQCXQ_00785 [Verrucomicrobiales bacterium]
MLWFCGYPLVVGLTFLLTDDGLRTAGASGFAFSLHEDLSGRLPGYVDRRIESGVAETLSVAQITATESPLYGAFFYLQATERLQRQWEEDGSLARESPAEVGKEAVEASVRILLDEGHAHWVRKYWGDDYLSDPNCFYRMLLIGGLTSHHNLTGSREHLGLLEELSEGLAGAIDDSEVGLVDDYQGQCFPCDVACAIVAVKRAGEVLGKDRGRWSRAALARMADLFPGALPPYMARAEDGMATVASRGCTNGFFLSYTRELDPVASDRWYGMFVEDFWQEAIGCGGWREFSATSGAPEWYFDADAGPVMFGFGTGATGLGLGCARAHGDDYRAGTLGAEMMVCSIPLPTGTLLVPRLVSDLEHAPYFGELAVLHQLSIVSADGGKEPVRAPIPLMVWGVLCFEALVTWVVVWLCLRWWFPKGWRLWRWRR